MKKNRLHDDDDVESGEIHQTEKRHRARERSYVESIEEEKVVVNA